MLTIRPGSHLHQFILTLAVVGEYPFQSLNLFGNERVWKELIRKAATPQQYLLPNGSEMTCKLLNISGKGNEQTIRFYKAGLPILEQIDPAAYQYYLGAFYGHRFPGGSSHVERNHRVAEAVVFCSGSGIECRPHFLPPLQNETICNVVGTEPALYLGKALKKIREAELNKTMFSRMAGALFYPGGCYALYNSRNALMKWGGMGEYKTLHSLTEIARLNAGLDEVSSAILLGRDYTVALRTLEEAERNRRLEFRFDGIFPQIHFIPMNEDGRRLLRLLTIPDWNEKIMDLLFEPTVRSYGQGSFEYDAYVNGVYVYSHLDGNIARLLRLKEAIQSRELRVEVLAYPFQTDFLQSYLGDSVTERPILLEQVEQELFGGDALA